MAEEFNFDDEERPESFFLNPNEGEDDSPASDSGSMEEREVSVVGVFEQHEEGGAQPLPFVLLKDARGRSVVILIGKFEAMSIWLALEGTPADRPLTHDLLNNVIARMGGSVERILIDDLWNSTYYAKVTVSHDGKTMDIDSRPSDAIALALRAKCPIFMVESVIERAKVQEE